MSWLSHNRSLTAAARNRVSPVMKTIATFIICSACWAQQPASLVNPFVGTSPSPLGEPGNTNPGATRPFGMLYWGPDQAKGRYYRFDNTSTRGFSLTHLSGTGCPAFGDVPFCLCWEHR